MSASTAPLFSVIGLAFQPFGRIYRSEKRTNARWFWFGSSTFDVSFVMVRTLWRNTDPESFERQAAPSHTRGCT